MALREMKVMTKHKEIKHGDYVYQLLGADKPTHVHIDNHKTKKQSVIAPLKIIEKLLANDETCV